MYNLLIILITFCSIRFDLCLGNDCHYSLSSVYKLFDLEIDRLSVIETYIENEYKRLDNIRRFIKQRKIQNEKELASSYTESSTNAFKTFLRIKTDWETLKYKMATTTKIENLKPISITDDNIDSAFKAIRRLQIIFQLETNILASGDIDNFVFEKLDVNDCFKIASLCYDNMEFHCAYTWFDEVNAKYNASEKIEIQFDHSSFLTKYIWSSYLVGDIDKAKKIFEENFQSHEKNDILLTIEYTIWAGHEVFKRNTADDSNKKFYSHSLTNLNANEEVGVFISACNPDSHSEANYLKCQYYHGGDKFLKIAPLRQEIVSIVPDIKLYHNVLFENEIKKIKKIAKPKLEKLSTDTNEDISLRKVAVFDKYNDTIFDVIHNRLIQLSLKSKADISNKYVVTNYGLAGHYLPHPQYIDNDHLINSIGRKAIIVFHMDNVPGGGCTVLPDADVSVPSIKGSALVVYNTRSFVTPYGTAYEDTQYGSCPILFGDKWTLTGWFEDDKFSYHDD